MRLILVVGTTRTAAIDGITAAGDGRGRTPAADAELVSFGRLVKARAVPMAPSGCPTPAVLTAAVRDLVPIDLTIVGAGLAAPTGAPLLDIGTPVGGDVRTPIAVPRVREILQKGTAMGESFGDEEVMIAESIPAGTTTALGVLRALGEDMGVSSSMPDNPIDRKAGIVAAGVEASDIPADEPVASTDALAAMGDPVLATVVGLVKGIEGSVTLAGGSQFVAAAAALRADGVTRPIRLATTAYVDADPAIDLEAAAERLDLDLRVIDPGFDPKGPFGDYAAGIAKEGVGMGGALALARDREVDGNAIQERAIAILHRCGVEHGP